MFGLMTMREHARIVASVLEMERRFTERQVADVQAYASSWRMLANDALAELKALRNPVMPDVGDAQTEKRTTRDADVKAAQRERAKQGAKRG